MELENPFRPPLSHYSNSRVVKALVFPAGDRGSIPRGDMSFSAFRCSWLTYQVLTRYLPGNYSVTTKITTWKVHSYYSGIVPQKEVTSVSMLLPGNYMVITIIKMCNNYLVVSRKIPSNYLNITRYITW